MFEYKVRYNSGANQWTYLNTFTRPIIDKSTLDESHDQTTLFLACDEREEAFKPFTRFIIEIYEKDEFGNVVDSKKLYRVVVGDEVTQKTFTEPMLYDHDITLAEASKELERYTVDNLSFTNSFETAYVSGRAIPATTNVTNYKVGDYTLVTSQQNACWQAIQKSNVDIGEMSSKITLTGVIKDVEQLNYTVGIPIAVFSGSSSSTYYDHSGPSYLIIPGQKYWRRFNTNFSVISCSVTKPDGTTISVSQGSSILLNLTGNYQLKYVVRETMTVYEQSEHFWVKSDWEIAQDEFGNNLSNIVIRQAEIIYNFSARQAITTINEMSIHQVMERLFAVTPLRFTSKTIDYAGQTYSVAETYPKFFCSPELDYLRNIESPEFIFTNKNLWEVLCEIGGVINAIPYIDPPSDDDWTVVNYLKLSSDEQMANTVEEEYCSSVNSYNSENYTSAYDMTIDNLVNPLNNLQGRISSPSFQLGLSVRSESVEISENDMIIYTQYPIYKILNAYFVTANGKIPFTQYIEEKAVYNTLLSYPSGQDEIEVSKCKKIYYTQGKNNLYGLTYKASANSWAAAHTEIAIKNIYSATVGAATSFSITTPIIIEYVPILSARIKFYKPNAPVTGISGTMFQSQSSNLVDTTALGRKMTANISRTGNRDDLDGTNVYHLNQIPLKGQRTADKYFVNTTYTEYDTHHLLNTTSFIKQYQKLSEYINIKSTQRFYEISEKQSIDRYVNTAVYYVFGNPLNSHDTSLAIAPPAPAIAQNPFIGSKFGTGYMNCLLAKNMGANGWKLNNSAIIGTYTNNNGNTLYIDTAIQQYTQEGQTYYRYIGTGLIKNNIVIATGNCINIICDMDDNYGAGTQAINYKDSQSAIKTDAFQQKQVAYSDNTYGIDYAVVGFMSDSKITYSSQYNPTTFIKNLPYATVTNHAFISHPLFNQFDEVSNSDNGITNVTIPTFYDFNALSFYVKKDNREAIHYNNQYHFLVNDENVKIGNALTDKCRYIQDITFDTKVAFLDIEIDDYATTIDQSHILYQEDIELNTANSIYKIPVFRDAALREGIQPFCDGGVDEQVYPSTRKGIIPAALTQTAKSWCILTGTTSSVDNEFIIGRNEEVTGGQSCNPIYVSITSDYTK